jgi:hypothetical protein
LIAIELAMNPNERIDSLDFLKICRADLDRLIEQSPPIPRDAIKVFESKFGKVKELKKPDICGSLEHTTVFNSNESRLTQVAIDATMLIKQRRATLNELLSPQIQHTIEKKVDERLKHALQKNDDDKEPPERGTRRGSITRDSLHRNQILGRPIIHKKDYHSIQLKPLTESPSPMISLPPTNVVVIPELHLNPLAQPIITDQSVLSPKPDHPMIASLD